MKTLIIILATKFIASLSIKLNLGAGSTWPGQIALQLDRNIIKKLLKKSNTQIIFVAGTNGKTTTSKLLNLLLRENKKTVIQNTSGANLINGIASTLITNTNYTGKVCADFAIFEVDENALSLAVLEIYPAYIILLNLFRDQLDRYGEVRSVAKKWQSALVMLPFTTTLIINADDPQIAFLGKHYKGDVLYFGLTDRSLNNKSQQLASDSSYCPNCGNKLTYQTMYFSHLGDYYCTVCKFKRPLISLSKSFYPQPGIYNRYNTLAAVLTAKSVGLHEKTLDKALREFTPAFGRQEILQKDGKQIQIFLSKNPTSMNVSLKTINELQARYILFILNDRIPDGRDVSWIWDVDIEQYANPSQRFFVSGDRAYDMTLRLKYAHPHVTQVDTYPILENNTISSALSHVAHNETLYILPTYSAMLDVRKMLTGKKIL